MVYLNRRVVFCTLLIFVLGLFSFCTLPDSDSGDRVRVLQGATLFDGTGSEAIENSVIVVKDDNIECVGTEEDCAVPAGAEVVDVSGKFITPGLVDAHVHFLQTGFFDGRPDALDVRDTYPYPETAAYQKNNIQRYFDAYLCSGITAVYDVGGLTWSIDLQESVEGKTDAPHVAAAGPLVTHGPRTILNPPTDKVMVDLESEESGRKTVRYLSKIGSTGIKVWFLGIDDEERQDEIDPRVKAVGDETEEQGNQLIVHATGLREAKVALEAGAELLVHSVFDQEVDQEFMSEAQSQGTIYTPTLVVRSGYTKTYRAAAGIAPYEIDDPHGCVDTKTRQLLNDAAQFKDHPAFTEEFKKSLKSFDPEEDIVSDVAAKNLMKVYEAGIPIAVGTDAGNPGTLHGPSIYSELEAMQKAGIPARDLIPMATRNGAKAMQRESDIGTLEAGKIADLIVLQEDPSADIANMRTIEQVMRRGQLMSVDDIASKSQKE